MRFLFHILILSGPIKLILMMDCIFRKINMNVTDKQAHHQFNSVDIPSYLNTILFFQKIKK